MASQIGHLDRQNLSQLKLPVSKENVMHVWREKQQGHHLSLFLKQNQKELVI